VAIWEVMDCSDLRPRRDMNALALYRPLERP
jgi:hypothetical protein